MHNINGLGVYLARRASPKQYIIMFNDNGRYSASYMVFFIFESTYLIPFERRK